MPNQPQTAERAVVVGGTTILLELNTTDPTIDVDERATAVRDIVATGVGGAPVDI